MWLSTLRHFRRSLHAAIWLTALLTLPCQAGPIVGFGVNKPPYVFEAQKNGLEVDLVKAAFKAAGIEIEPYFAPAARLHSMMEHRRIDAITTTLENSGVNAFYSDVYIVYRNYAITLASRKDITLTRIEDLAKYSVTAFQRAKHILGQRYHDAVSKSPNYSEQAQQEVRDLLLYSGRVDVAVADKNIFDYFRPNAAQQVDAGQPVLYNDIFPPTPYKMSFHDAALRDRFNAGLAIIRKNGEYEAIVRRYQRYMDRKAPTDTAH